MRNIVRARFVALTVLAAVAGSAAVGIAALAREGLCLHRLAGQAAASGGMARMPGMPGMAMDAGAGATGGPCPILIAAAIVAAVLYLLALAAIAVARPSAAEVALTSARIVLGTRFAPLAALITAVGAVPLAAALVIDGNLGATALVAAAFLLAAAAVVAAALLATARLIVSFARRLFTALAAAFRLLLPGADAPWLLVRVPVRVSAGVRLARRRPSRAPPSLR